MHLLSVEFRRSARAARFTMSGIFVFVAAITAWAMFTIGTPPAFAYPMFALCSTGLVGLGLLRAKNLNIPAALGTAIAVLAAGHGLLHATETYPKEQWAMPLFFLAFASIHAWSILILFVVDMLGHFGKEKRWGWYVATIISLAAVVVVFPLGLIISVASVFGLD